MARDVTPTRPGPVTATNDIFITIGNQPSLDDTGNRSPDGQGFAAFGSVIAGMDVVARIHASSTPRGMPRHRAPSGADTGGRRSGLSGRTGNSSERTRLPPCSPGPPWSRETPSGGRDDHRVPREVEPERGGRSTCKPSRSRTHFTAGSIDMKAIEQRK